MESHLSPTSEQPEGQRRERPARPSPVDPHDRAVERFAERARWRSLALQATGGGLVAAVVTLSAAMLAGPGSSLARTLARFGLMPGHEAAERAADAAAQAARAAFEKGDVEHLERAESLYALALKVRPDDQEVLADRLLAVTARAALLGRLARLDGEDAQAADDEAARARLEKKAVSRRVTAERALAAAEPARRALEHAVEEERSVEPLAALRALAALRDLRYDRRGAEEYLARAHRAEAASAGEDPWTTVIAVEAELARGLSGDRVALASARARLDRVATRRPGFLAARVLSARVAILEHDTGRALAALDLVLREVPTHEEAVRLAARIRGEERIAERERAEKRLRAGVGHG